MKLKLTKEEIISKFDWRQVRFGKDYGVLDIFDMEEKVSDYLKDYHFFPHRKNIQDVGVAAEMLLWLRPLIYKKSK